MFKRILAASVLGAFLVAPVSAQDWGFDTYDLYEPGFYDSASSDLYNDDDDWFYDSYTIGGGDAQQREEDVGAFDNSYGWEADEDLFTEDTEI